MKNQTKSSELEGFTLTGKKLGSKSGVFEQNQPIEEILHAMPNVQVFFIF